MIDKDMLTTALESSNSSGKWYLDRETGDVIPISEDFIDMEDFLDDDEKEREEYKEYKRITEDETGRYLYLEPMKSHEA